MSDTNSAKIEIAAMSVEEAARFLGLGQSSIWRAIREQQLAARKHGRRTLIMKEDALAYLRELPRAGIVPSSFVKGDAAL
jgi:excisionase family DNA binding protein